MKEKSKNKSLEIFSLKTEKQVSLVFVEDGIKAGFPSPADDFLQNRIDLNEELIKDSETTFLARVSGNSMQNIGIYDGDLMLIDRSLEPQNNHIAVCVIDGEFTLKRLKIKKENNQVKEIWLYPENADFQPIHVSEFNDFKVWGILTYSIKKFV